MVQQMIVFQAFRTPSISDTDIEFETSFCKVTLRIGFFRNTKANIILVSLPLSTECHGTRRNDLEMGN